MLDYVFAHPILSIFLFFISFPTAYFTVSITFEKRNIAKLGAFPPTVRAKLPLGIDVSTYSVQPFPIVETVMRLDTYSDGFLLLGKVLKLVLASGRGRLTSEVMIGSSSLPSAHPQR